MKSPLDRRRFLKRSLVASIGSICLPALRLLGRDPLVREGKPRLLLSLAAYSFRQYFQNGRGKSEKGVPVEKQIDMLQFVSYCADHGCQGAELTSYYFPENVTEEYLIKA